MELETTILFVEDNEDLRENAALVLGLEGYRVHLARDGREALDLLENGVVPNLIVSDIMMPRMDGYEFFNAVRGKPHLKAVPFIFLTARGSRRDIATGKSMGADDYLVKPFDPEDFLIAIQNKLKRVEAMREKAEEDLNDARRVLVQLISHELRTPLTYVTGGFALLAEELESQQKTDRGMNVSLNLIQNGTQRLNRLAEQMVLYSQIISGYVEQQVREVSERLNLDDLVTDALCLLEDLVQEREPSFNRITMHTGGVIVTGVKDLLVTAITEVIRNAVQYSPKGGLIELVVRRNGDYGTLMVMDHGPGIKPDDQATVWDVLVQSDRIRSEQQGAGMGLPLVKGIITAHGGEVDLYSVPGKGTQVMLQIPMAARSSNHADGH